MRATTCGLVAILGCLPVFAQPAPDAAARDRLTLETHAGAELGRFVQAVFDANPRLQAARSALQASRALESAAGRPLYNPEFEADYEDAVDETWEVGLGQQLDWAGKREARSSVAAAGRRSLEARYLAERRELAVDLLSGLAEYEIGRRRMALASERLQAMMDFADLARRRFETGDISQVDADLATLAAMDARIQRATAGTVLAESTQAVRSIVPRSPPSAWPSLGADLPAIPADADPQASVLALPEVGAAQQQVSGADALVALRQLERKPDPTLNLRAGQEDDSTLIGVNFSVPLYIRNSFSDEVAAAIAERDLAQQLLDDVLQRAYARYISATERYRVSRETWASWEATGQPSLERQGDVLRRLWEAGEISTTEFLVQLRQVLDTRENALDLELAIWRAWFEWLGASGQVDAWLNLEAN